MEVCRTPVDLLLQQEEVCRRRSAGGGLQEPGASGPGSAPLGSGHAACVGAPRPGALQAGGSELDGASPRRPVECEGAGRGL